MDSNTNSVKSFLELIRRRIVVILLITFSAGLSSYVFSFFIVKPVYEVKSTILVGGTNKEDIKSEDIIKNQNLTKTFSEFAMTGLIATNVANDVGDNITYQEIKDNLKIVANPESQLIEVSIQWKDPKKGVEIINSFYKELKGELEKFFPSGYINLLDVPQVPSEPIKPNRLLNVIGALFIGLVLSIGSVLFIESINYKLRTEEDVEKYLDLQVLSVIPQNR